MKDTWMRIGAQLSKYDKPENLVKLIGGISHILEGEIKQVDWFLFLPKLTTVAYLPNSYSFELKTQFEKEALREEDITLNDLQN